MKKILSVFLSIFLVLGLFLPAFADDASAEIDYTSGTPWLCSCLDGNVTADTKTPDLSEDFYLACNIEGLRNLQIPEGYSYYGPQDEPAVQLDEDIMKLFTSETEAGSHDAQLALNLYSLYMDWDSRNAVGTAPLKKLTDEVERIDSLEALTEYLGNTPVEYQLFTLFKVEIFPGLDDSSVNVLDIQPSDLTLEDSAEYQNLTALGKGRKDAATRKRQYILEDGQGRLFIAKDSSNGRPALRGTIQIDGKRYDMSGWYQPMRNRKDTKYINLRLREQSDPADNPIQDMLEGKL